MTAPKDLSHFTCEAEHLTIVLFFQPSPLVDFDSCAENGSVENSANKCQRLSPKNKYSIISYVELFIVRQRTRGCLGATGLFVTHVAYTFAMFYRRVGGKTEVNFRGRETSCHKRLNWARLARRSSQPTASFPSMTALAASHRRLASHLVPLCRTAGFLTASQDLETSVLLLVPQVFLCLILNYLISDFCSLQLATMSYDRLEFLSKY